MAHKKKKPMQAPPKPREQKPKPQMVVCPGCRGHQPKRPGDDPKDTIYFCEICRCQFDSAPDEGGDYDDRNPAARLLREERQLQKRREHQAWLRRPR